MKFILTALFILFSEIAVTQVFIPFGYWQNPTPLSMMPSVTQYIQPGDPISFAATGSTGSYVWSITPAASGDGATITTPGAASDYTGRLTAYASDTVTVTSATSLNISVITYNPISMSPGSLTMAVNTSQDFTVANGLCVTSPPTACTDTTAAWTVTSGAGSGAVDTNGIFTATGVAGTSVLQVQDAIGNTATSTITVSNSLQISPTSIKLGLYSTNLFTAILGTPPYTYSVFSGTGTMGCQSTLTGTHTAVVTTINVTSTTGCPPVGVVRINNEDVCYNSKTATTFAGVTRGCNATVAAAYTAGQTYNSNRAVYTAPSLIGAATVRVTDSATANSNAAVSIIRPVDVKTGAYFACALYDEGSLKCWGWNGSGQLGLGTTSAVGDSSLEIGGANLFVNVGTGRTVSKFAMGSSHVCAILDNTNLKCWGSGGNGKLGYGTTTSKGDNAGEMGDSLLAVDLGTGRYAVDIALGSTHTCALLDNATVKCWGGGASGRTGNETITDRGDNASEMGNFLPIVNLGTGRTATKIVAGLDYTCAILDNATVKCWGENQRGQLGKDSTTDLGGTAGSMGDTLLAINIGAGRTALDIIAGYETVCVKRDDNTMICWGRGNNGTLGNGGTATIGDGPGEMAAITAINMNAGFGTLSKIFALGRAVCAMDTLNVVKCWGYNAFGQLLRGNTTNLTSPVSAVMNFGTSLVPSKLNAYYDTICALFTNNRMKCFGRARTGTAGQVNGALINGSVENSLGDSAAEVGDLLEYVNH
jgi:alpha-tubulin suppressor-like RCC1 family protein